MRCGFQHTYQPDADVSVQAVVDAEVAVCAEVCKKTGQADETDAERCSGDLKLTKVEDDAAKQHVFNGINN